MFSSYKTEAQYVADTIRGHAESQRRLLQGIGWVRTPMLDNWYVEVQGGPQLYCAYEDNKASLAERITYGAEVRAGRWVFPMLGYRVGFGYGSYTGFVTKESYNNYKAIHPEGLNFGSTGQSSPGLHGYYHTYDADTSLYKQQWNYVSVIPDIMFNLSYALKYDPSIRFVSWIYAGVAFHVSLSDGYINELGQVEIEPSTDPNEAAEFHFGFIEKFYFTERSNIFIDARINMIEGTFDREKNIDEEAGIKSQDIGLYLHGGLSVDFNLRSQKKRAEWYRQRFKNTEITESEIPQHTYVSQEARINIIVDSIHYYDTISEFSHRYDSIFRQVVNTYTGDVVDSLRQAYQENCKEASLEDILASKLIPYEIVFFELDQWDILTTEEFKIARMAAIMNAFPDDKFLLIGSADSVTGSVKRNEFLSNNRVDVVLNKLVQEYGIDKNRLVRQPLGGILDYDPYELNRATVIIMDNPYVRAEFEKLRAQRKATSSQIELKNHK